MPQLNQENLARWISQAHIDYFAQYVKAWIPFNAWYRAVFDIEKDSEAIRLIKKENNTFRDRLAKLLNDQSSEGQAFRSRIGELNRSLDWKPIRNKGEIVSLQFSIEENPTYKDTGDFNKFTYFVFRPPKSDKPELDEPEPDKKIIARVSKAENHIFNYQHSQYDWEHLSRNRSFQNLTSAQQLHLKSRFDAIRPTRQIQLLTKVTKDRDCYVMGSYRFIRDEDRLCTKIIDTLYSLRNVLFHGEVVPDNDSNATYEAAYHILYTLIQALK